MGRPGVMLYFSSVPAINRLSLEDKGRLFDAIMQYAEHGVIPEIEGMTAMAFDFLRPDLDRDAERYEQAAKQKRYANYCKSCKKDGITPIAFDDWDG